ncbi:hypothetical protein MLD38_006463 [Melastoma candidum]|uniref:Uncharacterized protein n=1 Tax=Melastoma candidum TaxID=119954 RepID=A0ACB9RMZ9_9MYRT|nr:hypothetical protein MLD38_006463 [Melastoma candidum]
MSGSGWQWDNATAGALAGFATVAAMHPLDVVRTRFQANDGRVSHLPTYKNTAQALLAIARHEGFRGLYAGFYPAVFGSSVSWGLYFFFYGRAKERYSAGREGGLSPGLHLASAAEAGGLFLHSLMVSLLRLVHGSLGVPLHKSYLAYKNQNATSESSSEDSKLFWAIWSDALRTIVKEEGWTALYKGVFPSLLLQVSHGAIQFTSYEELRKIVLQFKTQRKEIKPDSSDKILNSLDYAALGASSKLVAILLTYPCQVVRTRLQQRPGKDGSPRYMDSWHVIKDAVRFEGVRGFYKGITANILKNAPASSVTFIVYENVMNFFRNTGRTKS